MNKTYVQVREVGLRDGLQMISYYVPTETKLEWLQAEVSAGLRAFDVTSFVSKSRMPQFADAEMMVKATALNPDLQASVLTLNERGAERAMEAGAKRLVFVISASASHSKGNAGRDTQDALDEFKRVVKLVKSANDRPYLEAGIATAFGCTIEGTIDAQRVLHLASRLAEIGADEIMLADTVGYANPRQVQNLFSLVRKEIGDLSMGAHFHDTRGLALANVVAALDAGVLKFDSALGGLGGCPFAPGASGNVATEDLVFLLQSMGYETNIDLAELLKIREQLNKWLPGIELSGSIARAGLPKNLVFK